MFVVILFLLGLSFGYAAGWPWGLLACFVPLLLTLAARDRSGGAGVVGYVETGIGVLAGLALAARGDEQHA
ncbi:MAG: hypothetical protein ACJ76Z_07970 [Thermoleophilaceae bacterium]